MQKFNPKLIERIAEDDPELAERMSREWQEAMIVLARHDPSVFCEYVLRNERTSGPIYQHADHERVHKVIQENRRVSIWTHPEWGKCLGGDTKVLCGDWTWKPLSSIAGDKELVIWDQYNLRLKKAAARIEPNGTKPCFELQFSNGASMIASHDHPFLSATMHWVSAVNLTVGESLISLGHYTPPAEETLDEDDFTLDEAFLLGILLNGRVTETGRIVLRCITRNEKLSKMRDNLFASVGWATTPFRNRTEFVDNDETCTMSPLPFLLAHAEVENGYPVALKSFASRLSRRHIERILSGFFASAFAETTPGEEGRLHKTIGVGDTRVPAGMGSESREQLEMIRLLLLRVGARSTVKQFRYSAMRSVGGGIWPVHGSKYVPVWTLAVDHADIACFWPTEVPAPATPRTLVPVTLTSKTPLQAHVWSVSVADVNHTFIAEGLVTHNTNQISIGHVLWRIGKDPNCSIAILSNTGSMASKIVSSLKNYIAGSPELHDVFPHLKPGEKWAEYAFTINRETLRKDPTVQAIGLTGNVVGSRLDGLIVDDLDDIDTVRTPEARERTQSWVRKQALTRLGPDGWAVMVGNVWHEKDAMHTLSRSGDWKRERFPVMYPDGDGGWISRDPVNFPIERILSIRDNDLGPVAFQQLYMLQPRVEGEQRFREEWINAALEKGKGTGLYRDGLVRTPTGCRLITGVDLGVKKKASADPTVITTLLEIPLGGEKYEMHLVNICKGRWNAAEIMEQIRKQQKIFGSEVWVEANAAQDFLVQLMNMGGSEGVPVKSFYTGRNKHDPMFGVESIAAEMSVGLWALPSWDGTKEGTDEEVEMLIDEMLEYTPNNHTGDILMSLWIAREAARTSRKQKTGTVQFGRLSFRKR